MSPNLDEISSEHKFIFNRLNKLTKSLVGVVKQNQQLKEANDKLRKEHDTWQNREAARERVIQKLQEVCDTATSQRVEESFEETVDAGTPR
jgi:FtsZ-binding cell division protein ZapB